MNNKSRILYGMIKTSSDYSDKDIDNIVKIASVWGEQWHTTFESTQDMTPESQTMNTMLKLLQDYLTKQCSDRKKVSKINAYFQTQIGLHSDLTLYTKNDAELKPLLTYILYHGDTEKSREYAKTITLKMKGN